MVGDASVAAPVRCMGRHCLVVVDSGCRLASLGMTVTRTRWVLEESLRVRALDVCVAWLVALCAMMRDGPEGSSLRFGLR